MSAAEIIEQIKSLPPQERATVAEFVEKASSAAQPIDLPDSGHGAFETRVTQIFDRYDPLFRKLAE